MTYLLGLWAFLLFGGFFFGRPDPYRRMPLWTRIASSGALVVLAWFLAARNPSPPHWLLAAGMTLGFVGDLFMADLVPGKLPPVLGGMGAFGVGHIAYIAAGLILGHDFPGGPRWLAWLMWLVLGAAGWYLAVWRPAKKPGMLHRAALPYALLLASTAGVGTGLALFNPVYGLMAIGGGLFLVSDLLIALDLFNGIRFRQMGDWIWLTYGPAQALILSIIYF